MKQIIHYIPSRGWLLLLALMLGIAAAPALSAQSHALKEQVLSAEDGEPLTGASRLLKGSGANAVSDASTQATEKLSFQPISWRYHVEPIGQDFYQLHITAIINSGWHLYSQHQPAEAIILPTAIQFKADSSYIIFEGEPKERGRMEKYENKSLGIAAFQYTDKVDFVQVVKLITKSPVTVSGSITYQACREQECLPPATTTFEFVLK